MTEVALRHCVYTDDFDRSLEEIVGDYLPAILGRAYPGWYLSHSTAATLRPMNGVAFISGHGSRMAIRLPGVLIQRVRALPHPEVVGLDLDVFVAPRLRAEPVPARVQLSSPLQTVFELLSRDARQPARSLPDETIRALIAALPEADVRRASAFARRNGLTRKLERFEKLLESLRLARGTPLRRAAGLEVYFYHWRVGRLEALAHGEFRFAYDDHWPIELSGLPRDRAPAYEGRELPSFFENLLPEGWAESRLRAVYKIARDDQFGLLRTTQKYLSNLTLRLDQFDASRLVLDYLDVRLEDLAPDPAQLLTVDEAIGHDPDTRELWLELRRRGATRLSGVQPKLPVHLRKARGRVELSLGDWETTSTHILKLPSQEFPQVVENEWAVMELARRVGLTVPAVRRVSFPKDSPLGSPALLVERFDLPDSLDDPQRLLLLEDAASLLGLRREDKYQTSLERVLGALQEAGVTKDDLGTHFDHVVFSWILGNGDLHAKNISVVHRIEPGRLGGPPSMRDVGYAPLYDLVCTRLVIRDDAFALPVNGKKSRLRSGDFAALAGRWSWPPAAARARIEDLGGRVRRELDGVFTACGLTEELQERLVGIVERNLDDLVG